MTKEPAGTALFADASSQGSLLRFGALSSKLGAGGLEDHTSDGSYMAKGPNDSKHQLMFNDS